MNIDETLLIIDKILQPQRLEPIEQFVLRQSLLGQTYSEMAQGTNYDSDYIKEIGFRLWQNLSEAFGERVTKKNLHLVLNHYQLNNFQQNRTNQNKNQTQNNYVQETQAQVSFSPRLTTNKINFPSAPVPLNSPFYINRPPIEEIAYQQIQQSGCVIRIKAPQRMGKTSLLNRMLNRAETLNYQTVYLNFQEADQEIFASLERFLRWFCKNISLQLHLNPKLDDYWDEDIGCKVSCKIYFEECILQQIKSPIVLVLDELHRVFEYPELAQEFLPMLRFWHEQAKRLKMWQKLRLVLAYATEFYVPLQLTQSPFNVGLAIKLPRFNYKQVQELALCYGLNWASSAAESQALESIQAMLGGHPYLTNLTFYYLHQGKVTWEELLQTAFTASGIYSDYLRGYLAILSDKPQLISALQQVVTADESVTLDAIAAYKLESMGLVQLEGDMAKPSCQLYRLYFQQHLPGNSPLLSQ